MSTTTIRPGSGPHLARTPFSRELVAALAGRPTPARVEQVPGAAAGGR